MLSGHLDAPYNTLPDKALANIAFLYGGDRCQCDQCDRCHQRKAFSARLISPGPDVRPLSLVPAPLIGGAKPCL